MVACIFAGQDFVERGAKVLTFTVTMRGYHKVQVQEFVNRVSNGELPDVAPEFDVVMRGYKRSEVDKYVRSLGLPEAPKGG